MNLHWKRRHIRNEKMGNALWDLHNTICSADLNLKSKLVSTFLNFCIFWQFPMIVFLTKRQNEKTARSLSGSSLFFFAPAIFHPSPQGMTRASGTSYVHLFMFVAFSCLFRRPAKMRTFPMSAFWLALRSEDPARQSISEWSWKGLQEWSIHGPQSKLQQKICNH